MKMSQARTRIDKMLQVGLVSMTEAKAAQNRLTTIANSSRSYNQKQRLYAIVCWS